MCNQTAWALKNVFAVNLAGRLMDGGLTLNHTHTHVATDKQIQCKYTQSVYQVILFCKIPLMNMAHQTLAEF